MEDLRWIRAVLQENYLSLIQTIQDENTQGIGTIKLLLYFHDIIVPFMTVLKLGTIFF